MSLNDTMHDRDIRSRNLVDGDVSDDEGGVGRVGEEEEVASVESWFHRAAVEGEEQEDMYFSLQRILGGVRRY